MSKVSKHIGDKQSFCPARLLCAPRGLPFILALMVLAGCARSASVPADVISADGVVTVRGNEPFTALVLETSDRNYYVLNFSSREERAAVQDSAPAEIHVVGEVYRDEWNGRAFAHLRVHEWNAQERSN